VKVHYKFKLNLFLNKVSRTKPCSGVDIVFAAPLIYLNLKLSVMSCPVGQIPTQGFFTKKTVFSNIEFVFKTLEQKTIFDFLVPHSINTVNIERK